MQVKSFAIWANAEKEQVPALVQSTIKWANDNNLEVYLADRLKSIDVGSEVSYFSSQNPPKLIFFFVLEVMEHSFLELEFSQTHLSQF